MAPNYSKHVLLLLLLLLPAFLCMGRRDHSSSSSTTPALQTGCLDAERNALLDFKRGLHDPGNRLSSWVVGGDGDYCAWHGVSCDNRTGHVVRLDLRNPHPYLNLDNYAYDTTQCFSGEINPSLLALTHLRHLDLSVNCFNGTRIPKFLGSFNKLRYLNLSVAGFSGAIPHELGNISSLRHLDLSWIIYDSSDDSVDDNPTYPPLYVHSLRWLTRLTSLQYLDMSDVDLSEASSHWVQALNALPSLRVLRLHQTNLDEIPHKVLDLNFTSLSVLDLSDNGFNSTVPAWLFNLSALEQFNIHMNSFHGLVPAALGDIFPTLQVLDLSYNDDLRLGDIPKTLGRLCKLRKLTLSGMKISWEITELQEVFSSCVADNLESLDLANSQLTGCIPESIGDLKKLKHLYLSENKLVGALPESLGRLSSLQELDLSENNMNGTVNFDSPWQLPQLVYFDLSSNSLEGILSEESFSTFAKLEQLNLDSNSLVLKVNTNWVPPFQLKSVSMFSCQVGPQFPAWLRTQVNLSSVDMSYAGINDTVPLWFWNFTSQLIHLDLSFNKIRGQLPRSLTFSTHAQGDEEVSVYLSSNLFHGLVPQIVSDGITFLDLSNNSLSGQLPSNIHESWPDLDSLSLSMNNINGTIPLSLCKAENLASLDLSSNQLSGEVPDCWSKFSYLLAIDLGNNNLSGGIPKSLCSLSKLTILHLRNNSLTGELPSSLSNCSNMRVLDLAQNKLRGNIPGWIGESLSNLVSLRLESNMFDGAIPLELSRLPRLHILDLSANKLSGTIPSTLGNLSAMRYIDPIDINPEEEFYNEDLLVVMKGEELKYTNQWTLSLVRVIDLSNNSLTGNIPEQVANLSVLQSLNLSRNLLAGQITEKIGGLRQLLSLDLSRNMLSGVIPQGLSTLTSLESLDLSYNDLSGSIPFGGQLQTFNSSVYESNANLCGLPLAKLCQNDNSPTSPRISSSGNVEIEDEHEEDVWLYASMGPGFVVGLWTFFGLLLFKRTWRHAHFRFVDNMHDRLHVAIVVNFARLKRTLWRCRNGGPASRT